MDLQQRIRKLPRVSITDRILIPLFRLPHRLLFVRLIGCFYNQVSVGKMINVFFDAGWDCS